MTSATGTFEAPAHQAGFTLVELAVAMLIIGLASAALVLALPDGGGARPAADRLAAHAAAARDTAIACNCPVRLAADSAGWRVLRATPGGWGPDPALKPVLLPAGLALDPAIVDFDATGLATPARLIIRGQADAAAVTIDAAGGVRAGAA